MTWARGATIAILVLAHAASGWAQEATRPATTTFWGDTGLWFVPTAEVLPSRDFSASMHRTEVDFRQGNTSVSFWPVTGAVGLGRVEVFGSMRVITRIDRDTVPLLFENPDNEAGGLVNEYPRVNETWTGNQLGDLYVGGKANLLSQERRQPLALAFRGTVKLPLGDRDTGAGTGEYDGFADLIASGEFGGIEMGGFGGVALRGDPDNIGISDGVRWGLGAGFPSRSRLRATAEVHGEWAFDPEVTAPPGLVVGEDGSLSPALSRVKDQMDTSVGVTWQLSNGLLLGAAVNYRFGLETAAGLGEPASDTGDAIGLQFRVGFHRGVKVYVPPAPAVAVVVPPAPAVAPAQPAPPQPAPAPAPAPTTAANRPPVVRAQCEPCAIEPGGTVRLRAQTSDPDGDSLEVRWSATGGTIADARSADTRWVAETAPGLVTFNVTVDDGRGGMARDSVTLDVVPGEAVAFDDVYFDFDGHRLRPDVLPGLDGVVAALKQRPGMQLEIEGHTCDLGTREYNIALGERRAAAVREYLIRRGIAAERLTTVSYGEERPAHDNMKPGSRPLNRRAVLVVHGLEDVRHR